MQFENASVAACSRTIRAAADNFRSGQSASVRRPLVRNDRLHAALHALTQLEASTMAKTKTLQDLFTDSVKDVYFAEKKILATLPKMAKAAQNPKLTAAFEKHMAETEGQIERLEQVFEELEESPKGKKCPSILGILEEGAEIMKEYKGTAALDAGLVASAQAVEHYEICRYGTLVTWAKELGLNQSVKLLKQTLNEEEKTDKALSVLAEGAVNYEAMSEAAE
jgi:ferritin-like metal-binding protein YciE